MVETEEHGVVPSCSFPAEDGMTVETGAAAASEARDVNLDLLLSNHNLLCTTCGANGRRDLQDIAIQNDVVEPRYGVMHDRSELEPIDDSSPFIQIDRNKCILAIGASRPATTSRSRACSGWRVRARTPGSGSRTTPIR